MLNKCKNQTCKKKWCGEREDRRLRLFLQVWLTETPGRKTNLAAATSGSNAPMQCPRRCLVKRRQVTGTPTPGQKDPPAQTASLLPDDHQGEAAPCLSDSHGASATHPASLPWEGSFRGSRAHPYCFVTDIFLLLCDSKTYLEPPKCGFPHSVGLGSAIAKGALIPTLP